MNELQLQDPWSIAVWLGVFIFIGWHVAYILCWIGQRCVAWIKDDKEKIERNTLVRYLVHKMGGTDYTGRCFSYLNKDEGYTEGVSEFYFTALATACIPLVLYIAYLVYPVTLFLLGGVMMMFVARMVFRHKKMFDEHCKDTKAHK